MQGSQPSGKCRDIIQGGVRGFHYSGKNVCGFFRAFSQNQGTNFQISGTFFKTNSVV